DAHVRPGREGDVVLLATEDVEVVWPFEHRRIAVRRAEAHADGRSGRDGDAGELDVTRRRPADAGERRLPAQALLDGPRNRRAIAPQRLELVAVREQTEEQVARR